MMFDTPTDLTPRRQQVLRAIIEQHVASAMPVASDALVHGYGLDVSSATVRNEMAALEDLGLIYQPHTSAGRVPSEQGYRYYVANLVGDQTPSAEEQRTIQHQFYQVELRLGEWLQLAVSVLARGVQNAAIASAAETEAPVLRQIDLVALHDAIALLILVSRHAAVSQQVVALPQPASSEELSGTTQRLNRIFGGKTAQQIDAFADPMPVIDQAVRRAMVELLDRQANQHSATLFHDGLANLLSQPEYSRMADSVSRQERMRQLMHVVERGDVVRELVPTVMLGGSVRVLIGEQRWDQIRDCTLILAPYGGRTGTGGVVGVVGPTRMDYARTIGVVRYITAILSALTEEFSVW